MSESGRSPEREPDVLILGVDHRLVEACRARGLEPLVVCEPYAWSNRRFHPDDVRVLWVDDHRVPAGILAELHRAGLAGHEFAAVITANDSAMLTAGLLGRHLGAPAIDPDVALRFTDKSVQKEVVRAAGIRTARTVVIDDSWVADADAAMVFDRAVLKPIAGSGTVETTLINSAGELWAKFGSLRMTKPWLRKFLLEEFVPGDEWFADGIVVDGELLFMSVSKYGSPLLSVVTQGVPLWLRRFDPDTEAWAYDTARPLVEKSLAALGLRTGVFHLELFRDPVSGEVSFGECAARYAGAFTCEEVRVKFNVDLAGALLDCALGKRPEIDVRVRPGMVGNIYVPCRPGTVMRCPSAADLEQLDNVVYASVDTPIGTFIPPDSVIHSSVRIAQVLLATDTEERFLTRADEIRAWFYERLLLAPLNASTDQMWEWQRTHYSQPVEETSLVWPR